MILLDGLEALPGFRRERLNARLDALGLPTRVAAATWFYCIESEAGAAPDPTLLATILEAPRPHDPAAHDVVVLPRLGTISPWSTKATEILHGAGLPVRRVERGCGFRLAAADGLDAAARRLLWAALHDPMTQSIAAAIGEHFHPFLGHAPAPLVQVPLAGDPHGTLARANRELGLALSDAEIGYLADAYAALGRDPTDAELMMFAQANSEHCRHKVFNAAWTIDGVPQAASLFGMIKSTHAATPAHTLTAYADNAAVIEGHPGRRLRADADERAWRAVDAPVAYAIKVETHNHPTAIAPFPGAATGAGGEIRDEGATGRGGKPKAGLTGFTVSDLRIPGLPRPWESDRPLNPRMASAFEIMRDGPIGAAAFNNEFGRPALAGYFRSFETPGTETGLVRGYDKPIMLAGGLANLDPAHVAKGRLAPGDLVVVLGGPAMLIGLGGGAASSLAGGDASADIDFASVQRDNAEMQRRCQEVIERCTALGADNPIITIHDVGAGGLSNAIPELLHDSDVGGIIELRDVPSDDAGLSPMQIWCNESQERYVLGIAPAARERFAALAARERCPWAVVGVATEAQQLVVSDRLLAGKPIDLPMGVLFGSTPRMQRTATRTPAVAAVGHAPLDDLALDESMLRVLRHPTVAAKTFLITIGDRTVGGLCSRDQLVGPWQVPVADCALTLVDFDGHAGEAMAIGERTPLALADAAASARIAIGEALTNLMSAPVAARAEVKLSANWMAAVSHSGEDLALYDAVHAAAELCRTIGVSIPVGKDSLSMQARWPADGAERRTVAPVSLVVSAFARVADVRRALTPQLDPALADNRLLLIDLGGGRHRLGGSMLAQVWQRDLGAVPDLDDPARLAAAFDAVQALNAAGLVQACHDRSDGGLAVTLAEMAFAARCGLDIDLGVLAGGGVDPRALLFAEELGIVLQVRGADLPAIHAQLAGYGLADAVHEIGRALPGRSIRIRSGAVELASFDLHTLLAAWYETSHAIQRWRDDPAAADSERDSVLDATDPGLAPVVPFDPADDIAAPWIARGVRPAVAILREQGVNGQVEMAAAFMRAGFDAHDVHMTDLIEGRSRLDRYQGFVACGGFSYGDVLGAGRGWAASIRWRPVLAEQFAAFLADRGRFALGVCNGCQMLAQLRDLIPGAAGWPRFVRNRSEQFEARLALVEVLPSPSLFFAGMAGARLPVAVAHGEGRVDFEGRAAVDACLRFVDNHGAATERYPANPNGSAGGATGYTTPDGRVTILMPHPERVFRSAQLSWHPSAWGEASPWLRMFRNARAWVA
jgi:phosphoribosylformylglycinamidine synthase